MTPKLRSKGFLRQKFGRTITIREGKENAIFNQMLGRIFSFYMLFVVAISQFAFAQPDALWIKVFEGNGDEFGNSVQQTSDGGYIITGGTNLWPSSDTFLKKTDPNGNVIWTKMHGRIYYDTGQRVHQTPDGGYIIGGFASMTSGGREDFYLIKTDANGEKLWSQLIAHFQHPFRGKI